MIDDTTDCRVDPCAVTVRRDDTAGDDRTSDLFVPVTFLDEAAPTTSVPPTTSDVEIEAAAATATPDDGGGGSTGLVAAAALFLAAVAGGTWFVQRRVRT